MDLELRDITRPGRRAAPLESEVLRPLRGADLALLQGERGSTPTKLKRISERHHALARSIAAGLKQGEAAAVVGMCQSRISILMDDPAFKELVEFYRENKDAVFAEMYEHLAGLGKDALLLLRERIEDEPDDFSNGQLLEILTKLADRTGHGPQTSTTNLNVNVGIAGRLEEGRKRALAAARGEVIEHELNEQ